MRSNYIISVIITYKTIVKINIYQTVYLAFAGSSIEIGNLQQRKMYAKNCIFTKFHKVSVLLCVFNEKNNIIIP